MDIQHFSIPQNGTVPITDIVSARVSQRPVSIPLSGSAYTRLENVTGVPQSGDGGYSLARIRAIDALIARIRGTAEAMSTDQTGEQTLLELHEELLEEVAFELDERLSQGYSIPGVTEGLLLDIAV